MSAQKFKSSTWKKDLYGTPENKEIAALRGMSRESLKFLCKELLGMSKWDDGLHNDLAEYLDSSGSSKLILLPRGHLKSSLITIGWSIQQILRNPDIRILIRNAVWDKARTMLWSIQGYLEGGTLPAVFNRFCTPRTLWTKDSCTISQRNSKVVREPTLMTAGLETSLTGYHFDIIIDDDLVDQFNSTTKEQIQKVIDVYNDSFNLLDRGGKHVVIGTRWNVKDLYGHILATDCKSVNGVPVDLNKGGEEWRKMYLEWIKRQKVS